MSVIAGFALFFLHVPFAFAFRTAAVIFIVAHLANSFFLVAIVWEIALWASYLFLIFYSYLRSNLLLLDVERVCNIKFLHSMFVLYFTLLVLAHLFFKFIIEVILVHELLLFEFKILLPRSVMGVALLCGSENFIQNIFEPGILLL